MRAMGSGEVVSFRDRTRRSSWILASVRAMGSGESELWILASVRSAQLRQLVLGSGEPELVDPDGVSLGS